MTTKLSCWCGNKSLHKFSEDYRRCSQCETLIWIGKNKFHSNTKPTGKDDYYGKGYWFDHQEKDLGLPNIKQRAREDLPDRCLYWLEHVLKYKLPPANVLEIGCGHGGFVKLLRDAGYEAKGLELDPWITKFAENTFNIPMFTGPIESQILDEDSYDILVLMDVLEHLPTPKRTIEFCLRLLKDNGLFVIQTPSYPDGKSLKDLDQKKHPFIDMMIPQEHFHLFSKQSIRKLFSDVGRMNVWFEPAFFPEHDMFFIASGKQIFPNKKEIVEEYLLSSPSSRVILGMFDQRNRLLKLNGDLLTIESERAEQVDIIDRLTNQIKEIEKDRDERLELINQLNQKLEIIETDRDSRLDLINHLSQQLEGVEKDRAARLDLIEQLNLRIESINDDRNARLELIHQLNEQLAIVEADRAARLDLIEQLTQRLDMVEADLKGNLKVIDQLNQQLELKK